MPALDPRTWTLSPYRLIAGALGALLLLGLVRAFQPTPVLVDVAEVARRPLLVTVQDDGRTRVRERYTVSAPIQGRLLRTPLDPGDPVRADATVVAEFEPIAPDLLDARSKAEAQARVQRADAALREARAMRAKAAADLEFAQAELVRTRELSAREIAAPAALDEAERAARSAREGLRASEFAVQVAEYELELARATLRGPEASSAGDAATEARVGSDGRLELRSPVDGTVLRVLEESARTLAAGTPILEIGNTGGLEIVVEFLSQDAVQIRPGMPVRIGGFSGGMVDEPQLLRGSVRLVEPAGFTKISALGVEEQRVNVLVDPEGTDPAWAALGDGYRVEVEVVVWQADDVVVAPTGALFRDGERWAVYVVDGDRARIRPVGVGRQNGLEAQILEGLAPGERVVVFPSDLIFDGVLVDARLERSPV